MRDMTVVAARGSNGWGRLLIYALLGPLFGAFAIFGYILFIHPSPHPVDRSILASLMALLTGPLLAAPIAYVIGFLPALAVGIFDRWLWKRRSSPLAHLSAITLAGIVVCFLLLGWTGGSSINGAVPICAVGAFAAVACYLVSSLFRKPRAAEPIA